MGYNYYQAQAPHFRPPIFDLAGGLSPRAWTWRGLLYDLLFAVWEVKLPEGWHLSPFRYMLFGWGSLGVAYAKDYGWIYGFYGVERIDWQYTPILFNVTLNGMDAPSSPIIGVRGINGAVLHVRDDWTGYGLLIDQTAALLASCDKGLEITLKQARTGKLIPASSKKDATSIKGAIAEAQEGEAVAMLNEKLFNADGTLKMSSIMDPGREYMGDKLLATRMMIIKDYLMRIGVRTVAMEKREHLLNQEIAENNDETSAEPLAVTSSLREDLDLLGAMGCAIEIRPRFDYSGAGIAGGREEDNGIKSKDAD